MNNLEGGKGNTEQKLESISKWMNLIPCILLSIWTGDSVETVAKYFYEQPTIKKKESEVNQI